MLEQSVVNNVAVGVVKVAGMVTTTGTWFVIVVSAEIYQPAYTQRVIMIAHLG